MNKFFAALLSPLAAAAKDIGAQVLPAVIANVSNAVTGAVSAPPEPSDLDKAAAAFVQKNPNAILIDAFAAGAAYSNEHHANAIGDMITHVIVKLTGANEKKVDAVVDAMVDVASGAAHGGIAGAVAAAVTEAGQVASALSEQPAVVVATVTVPAGAPVNGPLSTGRSGAVPPAA